MDLTKITSKDFDPSVGDVFVCQTMDGDVHLTLDNIKMLSATGRPDAPVMVDGQEVQPRDPFALTFEGPSTPILQQGIYTLSSEKTGQLELFVVPFKQETNCTLYESIFN